MQFEAQHAIFRKCPVVSRIKTHLKPLGRT